MPKIKLSALATDIKGKSGGSVFARNKGGLYFRNNPSGGGKKSPKWAQARSAFASLSGLWRELTNDQKQAWNTAVDNYNTTGAFGDVRVPSGYELFMRLNGPLNKLGLPLLDVPEAPEAFPTIGKMFLTTLDEFLYTPFHGYAPFGYGVSNACSNVQDCDRPGETCVNGKCIFNASAEIVTEPIDISNDDDITYSALFSIPESAYSLADPAIGLPLNSLTPSPSNLLTFFLFKNPSGKFVLRVILDDGTNSLQSESEEFKMSWDQPIRFTFIVSKTDNTECRFFANQTEIPFDKGTAPTSPLSLTTMNFDILPKDQLKQYPILIQDVRLATNALTDKQLGKMIYGYEVAGLLLHFGFDVSKDASFKNFGSFDQDYIENGPFSARARESFPRKDFNVQPWLLLFSDTVGIANEVLVFKSTNPSSRGRIGNRVGFRRLGVQDWEGRQYFQFGTEFIKEFGTIINNSTIRPEVQTLNTKTGQMSEAVQIEFVANTYGLAPNTGVACSTNADCAGGGTCIDGQCVDFGEEDDDEKESPTKFKAGAELSKSVN